RGFSGISSRRDERETEEAVRLLAELPPLLLRRGRGEFVGRFRIGNAIGRRRLAQRAADGIAVGVEGAGSGSLRVGIDLLLLLAEAEVIFVGPLTEILAVVGEGGLLAGDRNIDVARGGGRLLVRVG